MESQLVHCPACGDTTPVHRVSLSLYSPSVLVALGGPVLALVFDRSRKQQFWCEKCHAMFSRHTLTSGLFQVFWIWFLISLGLAIVLLFAGYVVF
jgi:transposase-like protein